MKIVLVTIGAMLMIVGIILFAVGVNYVGEARTCLQGLSCTFGTHLSTFQIQGFQSTGKIWEVIGALFAALGSGFFLIDLSSRTSRNRLIRKEIEVQPEADLSLPISRLS